MSRIEPESPDQPSGPRWPLRPTPSPSPDDSDSQPRGSTGSHEGPGAVPDDHGAEIDPWLDSKSTSELLILASLALAPEETRRRIARLEELITGRSA